MRRSYVVLALFVGIVALVLAPWAAAQIVDPDGAVVSPSQFPAVEGPPPGHVQPDFGTGNLLTQIHAPNWTPFDDTVPPSYNTAAPGYLQPGALQASYYWTQLNLPLGATIHHFYAFVYDNDVATWNFIFRGYETPTYAFTPSYHTFGSASTTGTPGYTLLYLSGGETVIRAFADLNSDGAANEVSYDLLLGCGPPSAKTNMRFWGAEVNWSRTISPAPATATFPDVPPGFWAFQYIEALVDSGITTGQPDGNFHPTDPVTRAQMAVFLARALGLHWDN